MAGTVSGTATYRDRSALPPDAVFEVVVEDVSLADAPAKAIGRKTFVPQTQVPIGFEVTYDDAGVQPRLRYSVRARITVDGKLLYVTTQTYPVLTMGAGNTVDLQLQRVGATPSSSIDAGGPPDRSPTNTYWKLVELGRTPVVVVPNQREPHLLLHTDGDRVTGSGGCNSMTGSYVLHGGFVSFAQMAVTMMACADGMAQEAAYFRALQQVKSWRVRGDTLELLDGANAVLLKFAAVDLR